MNQCKIHVAQQSFFFFKKELLSAINKIFFDKTSNRLILADAHSYVKKKVFTLQTICSKSLLRPWELKR